MNDLPIDKLSDEEIETLKKIQTKLLSDIKKQYENLDKNYLQDIDTESPYAFNDIDKPLHLSDEDRELVFYIRAEISTIDHSTKRYLSLDTCLDETYHIPVPSGCNLQTKINEFMSTLESVLSPLAQKIHAKTEQ